MPKTASSTVTQDVSAHRSLLLGEGAQPPFIKSGAHVFSITKDVDKRLRSVMGRPVTARKLAAYQKLHFELSFALGQMDRALGDRQAITSFGITENEIGQAQERRESLQAKCNSVGLICETIRKEYDGQPWGLGGRFHSVVPAGR